MVDECRNSRKRLVSDPPDDRFGIGYFYKGTSQALQDELAPFADLEDKSGMEMFYDFGVTPWFRVTADLQVVNPATGGFGDAVFAGLALTCASEQAADVR